MTRDDTIKIFSKGFSKYIARKNLTLEATGALLGCGVANVFKIKSGKGLPSIDGVFTLVENGMTLDEIFGAELAKKLLSENPPEDNPLEVIMKKPPEMTEEEFDRKLKGSLKRLLGNLDIK